MLNRVVSLDLQSLFSIKLLTGSCSESVAELVIDLSDPGDIQLAPGDFYKVTGEKRKHAGFLSAASFALLELGNGNFSHPSPMTVLKAPQSVVSHSSPPLLYIGCFAPKAP